MKPPSAILILALVAGVLAPGCRSRDSERPPLQPFPDSVINARRLPVSSMDTTALPLRLPDIVLPTLEGDSLRLSSYRGQTVLLTFWATWCPPCLTDIPGLNQLSADLREDGVVLIGVTAESDPEKVRAFANAYGIQYPVALGAGSLSRALGGVYSLPTSFIITPDGRVVERITGSLSPADLQSRLRPTTTPP